MGLCADETPRKASHVLREGDSAFVTSFVHVPPRLKGSATACAREGCGEDLPFEKMCGVLGRGNTFRRCCCTSVFASLFTLSSLCSPRTFLAHLVLGLVPVIHPTELPAPHKKTLAALVNDATFTPQHLGPTSFDSCCVLRELPKAQDEV